MLALLHNRCLSRTEYPLNMMARLFVDYAILAKTMKEKEMFSSSELLTQCEIHCETTAQLD